MISSAFIVAVVAIAASWAIAAFLVWRQAGVRAEILRVCERLEATLASVPAGYIAWPDDGPPVVSDNLAQLVGGDAAPGYEHLRGKFGEGDGKHLDAMVEALRAHGDEFSVTLLTLDAGQALRLDGRRARTAPLDVLWVADVTNETAIQSDTAIQLTAAEVERDGLRAMLDALPIPVWRRSKDLTLAQINRSYIEAVEPEAAEPGTGGEVRPSELAEIELGAEGKLAALAQATGSHQSESRYVVIGGARRLMEFNELYCGDMGIIGYALDYTQLESVQEELASHIAAQSEVLENVTVAIAIYGSDTRLKFYNAAYARLWDADTSWLDTEPTLGEELEKLYERRMITEEVDFRAYKAEQIALFTSLIAPSENLVHLPDGKTLFKRISPHPFGGLLFTYEDVTDRLTLEGQYNTLIEVQRRTLDNLYEGVALVGPDGRLKLCNASYARIWEFSEPDLHGEPHINELIEKSRHFYDVTRDWETQRREIASEMMAREPVRGTLERSDGSVVEYTGVPLPDGMMLMTYIDVSDRHRVERALRERNEALEQADQLKSEFVANVSYELRTPLNTIIGFAEVLNGDMFGPLNDKQSEYLSGILEASESLLDLINDILDLATIEAGYLTLERDNFDVHAMIASVFSLNRERARLKELKLVLDCPPTVGSINADERRLKQVLFNLVSNAIKFTPEGGTITLGAYREDDNLVFFVSDTGVGIPEGEQERVLEKFERGTSAAGRQMGVGAGLGLSLVRSLVQLHGGAVILDSVPDAGTRVSCRIPAEPPQTMAVQAVGD